MKKYSYFICFLLLLLSCKTSSLQEEINNEKPEYVSLIAVIANPEKYHNKKIIVDGYFTLEKEGEAIYVNKTDYENLFYKNAVYLFVNYDKLKKYSIEPPYKGYVKIEGIFNKDKKGSYNFFSGSLDEIKEIHRLYKRDGENEEYNMN
jgi:hypothetical protein